MAFALRATKKKNAAFWIKSAARSSMGVEFSLSLRKRAEGDERASARKCAVTALVAFLCIKKKVDASDIAVLEQRCGDEQRIAVNRRGVNRRAVSRLPDVQRVRLLPDVREGLALLLHAGPRPAADAGRVLRRVRHLAAADRAAHRRDERVLRRQPARPAAAQRDADPVRHRRRRRVAWSRGPLLLS